MTTAKQKQMIELVSSGLTSRQISDHLKISRQAVHICGKTLGLLERLKANNPKKPPKPPRQCIDKYGFSRDETKRLISIGATRAYREQRRNARVRNIEWLFTFRQWWKIWQDSGKWEIRGKTKGCWVMGRPGDIGPYSESNVVICTHGENMTIAQSHANRSKGCIWKTKNKKNPWTVKLKDKYIGAFHSYEEAKNKLSKIILDIGVGT